MRFASSRSAAAFLASRPAIFSRNFSLEMSPSVRISIRASCLFSILWSLPASPFPLGVPEIRLLSLYVRLDALPQYLRLADQAEHDPPDAFLGLFGGMIACVLAALALALQGANVIRRDGAPTVGSVGDHGSPARASEVSFQFPLPTSGGGSLCPALYVGAGRPHLIRGNAGILYGRSYLRTGVVLRDGVSLGTRMETLDPLAVEPVQ